MGRAKDIIVKVIPAKAANKFIKKHHYSGKVVPNSNLHFGAFLDNKLHGVLSYGSSFVKKNVIKLVEGTGWNEFIELNRMAFDDYLPKNSESRCIAVSIRLIKKNAPHIKWILSFADSCQCGDGIIYRASGFYLTGIKKNDGVFIFNGEQVHGKVLWDRGITKVWTIKDKELCDINRKGHSIERLDGFQLRYIYLIDKSCKITVPILPFSKIDEMGAGMYKGVKRSKQAMADTSCTAEGQNLPGRSKEKAEVV